MKYFFVNTHQKTIFDNVFYKVEMVNVDINQKGTEFMISDMNNPATFTFEISDAYFLPEIENFAFFFGELPPEPPLQGVIEGRNTRDHDSLIGNMPNFISSLFIEGDISLTVAECTGYPTKTTIYGTIAMLVDTATEAAATFTIMAIDENFNLGIATQTINVDTLAPVLTHVQGLKRNKGPGNDGLQFAFRAEDEVQGVFPKGATVTVLKNTEDDSERFLPVYYSKEHIERLTEGSRIWMIDPLSMSVSLDSEDMIQLEILAADGYGNEGTSTLEGQIIKVSESR